MTWKWFTKLPVFVLSKIIQCRNVKCWGFGETARNQGIEVLSPEPGANVWARRSSKAHFCVGRVAWAGVVIGSLGDFISVQN